MRIVGLGTAVPESSVEQSELARLVGDLRGLAARERRRMEALFRRSGVERRAGVVLRRDSDGTCSAPLFADVPGTATRMEAYHGFAVPLAVAAAQRALEDAGIAAGRVTHLVTASCTGFLSPGVDLELCARLPLPATTERTHVGFMGCHGALNAIRVASALAGTHPAGVVLVVVVELPSLHFLSEPGGAPTVGEAIFADGAAALVGVPGVGAFRVAATASRIFPDSAGEMTWRIGDHGFVMHLSPGVPDRLAAGIRPWLEEWLRSRGLALAAVPTFAIHPGGPRILSAVAEALQLPSGATDVSREVLARHGNMSAATILFLLERLRDRGAPRPILALAFGPGLAAEACLILDGA